MEYRKHCLESRANVNTSLISLHKKENLPFNYTTMTQNLKRKRLQLVCSLRIFKSLTEGKVKGKNFQDLPMP